MDQHADEYIAAIRKYVCSVCKLSERDDESSSAAEPLCTIERFLPEIVEVATTVESDRIDDYVSALRDTICRVCRPHGETECAVRDSDSCGLDRYFVLLLEAIEHVILEKKAGQFPERANGLASAP